jgi:tetratricopeptide (TPR) repeat protein
MDMRSAVVRLVVVVGLALPLVSCNYIDELQAMKRFKEANVLYQRQDYDNAAAGYEEVIAGDPDITALYFYLGNSYDNLYKLSRRGEPQNDAYLDKAVENYKIAVEREQDPDLRRLAMQYLVAAYGSDKLNDPSSSEPVLQQMIKLDPSDPANYFALGKLYEDAGQYELAESTFVRVREVRQDDSAVYLQLAGFYNRQGEFEKTIEALETRASKEPDNPEAHYTIATYFWEKAFRDFRLTESEKQQHVTDGLAAVDRALNLKDDYTEALVYKNILLRMQANMEKDLDIQKALIAEADELRDRAEELQEEQAAGAGVGT